LLLRPGDTAPDFDVLDHSGRRVKLSDFHGRMAVVLYFYPKDFTSICTAESCGFRDMYRGLASANVEVVGVSLDSADSHRRFATRYDLPFSLISDSTKDLTKRYGALSTVRSLLGLAKRLTYVIDRDGKVAGVFEGELSATPHLQGVKDLVARLA
jgi:thioredoxin-dependent peroxiredoxin